jgi:DNA-binding phage protein
MRFRNPVKFSEMTFGLFPKVLDAVDGRFASGKALGMIDAQMPEVREQAGVTREKLAQLGNHAEEIRLSTVSRVARPLGKVVRIE